MLSFSPLQERDFECIVPILNGYPTGACDTTAGGMLMWRVFFNTRFALADGALYFKLRYYDGSERLMFPVGKDPERELSLLLESEPNCTFAALTAEQLVLLRRFGKGRFLAKFERNICDYLYDPKELSTLAGRKFAGQRNHCNFFRQHYDVSAQEITEWNLEEALSFYDANFRDEAAPTPLAAEEKLRARELLENKANLSLYRLMLYADSQPVALSVGEFSGDTLFVHVEKALRAYRGAHQCMLSEFARVYGKNCRLINREEDDGTPGLRQAKLALHPVGLLKKYSAVIN